MRTLLDNRIRKTIGFQAGVAGLLLIFLLLLAGCEPPSSTPGSRPGGVPGRPGAQAGTGKPFTPGGARSVSQGQNNRNNMSRSGMGMPSNGRNPVNAQKNPLASKPGGEKNQTVVNPLAPTVPVEQAGNPVELASVIIAVKANPFLDWLPKPLMPTEIPIAPGASEPVAIAADPFANVTLLGVMYNARSPMVLIAVTGQPTQFVSQGDMVNLETDSAIVTGIREDGADLKLMSGTKETRTLTLPSIIGYSAGSSNAGAGTGSLAASSPEAPSAEGMAPAGLTKLGNLKKLAEQALPHSSKGAQINLKEL